MKEKTLCCCCEQHAISKKTFSNETVDIYKLKVTPNDCALNSNAFSSSFVQVNIVEFNLKKTLTKGNIIKIGGLTFKEGIDFNIDSKQNIIVQIFNKISPERLKFNGISPIEISYIPHLNQIELIFNKKISEQAISRFFFSSDCENCSFSKVETIINYAEAE